MRSLKQIREALIILDQATYDKKMLNFLTQSGAKSLRYPFTDYNETMRAMLEKKSTLFNSKTGESFKVIRVVPPRIYGQVKLHKNDHPIRPVIAFCTHPSYKIAAFLADWFKGITTFSPQYAIKNSILLADELCKKRFSKGSILFSIDEISMFTRILVKFTTALMIKMLRDDG